MLLGFEFSQDLVFNRSFPQGTWKRFNMIRLEHYCRLKTLGYNFWSCEVVSWDFRTSNKMLGCSWHYQRLVVQSSIAAHPGCKSCLDIVGFRDVGPRPDVWAVAPKYVTYGDCFHMPENFMSLPERYRSVGGFGGRKLLGATVIGLFGSLNSYDLKTTEMLAGEFRGLRKFQGSVKPF